MLENFRIKEAIGAFTRKLRGVEDGVHFRSDITVEIRDKFGNLKSRSVQHNLRVNGGADFWDAQLFNVASAGATANYIALTANSTTPAATDTTLTGEITTNGLARAQATDAHTSGNPSSVLSYTFTYTGSSSVTIAKVGLFNASSGGTLVLETLLTTSGTVSASGDTIMIQWTINF